MRPRSTQLRVVLGWLAVLSLLPVLGCAARTPWREVEKPEALVDVLPRSAAVEVDGRPLGPGSRAVPVPDPSHLYRFRASAPGFDPAEATVDGAKAVGARIALVLRPQGYGLDRRLEMDDPSGLAAAGAQLLRTGKVEAAVDYAQRAEELARDLPLPHRVLGAAYARLGRRQESLAEYTAYLNLSPDAPDAAAVRDAMEQARGDLTVPPPPGR